MHTLGKINGIEHLDPIAPPLQESPHLGENPALWIDHHKAAPALFLRAGLEKLRGVEVAGVGRIFGAGVHGKKLRPGEDNIVFKDWIDERGYIFRPAPSGAPELLIPPEFLCVLVLEVDQQPEAHRAHNAPGP